MMDNSEQIVKNNTQDEIKSQQENETKNKPSNKGINIIKNYKSTEELEKEVLELQKNMTDILTKNDKLEAKLNHELKIILLNQKTIIGQLDLLTKRNNDEITTQPLFPFLSTDIHHNLRDRNWHIRKKQAYKFIPEPSNTNLD